MLPSRISLHRFLGFHRHCGAGRMLSTAHQNIKLVDKSHHYAEKVYKVLDPPKGFFVVKPRMNTRQLIFNDQKGNKPLTLAASKKLNEIIEMWTPNDFISAVILRGNGMHFCGGLTEYQHIGNKDLRLEECRAVIAIHNLAKKRPVFSVLDGSVVGAGYRYAQGRHRIATENTVWSLPDALAGLGLSGGLSHTLAHLGQPPMPRTLSANGYGDNPDADWRAAEGREGDEIEAKDTAAAASAQAQEGGGGGGEEEDEVEYTIAEEEKRQEEVVVEEQDEEYKAGVPMGLFLALGGRPLNGRDMIQVGMASGMMMSETLESFASSLAETAASTYGPGPVELVQEVYQADPDAGVEFERMFRNGPGPDGMPLPPIRELFEEVSSCFGGGGAPTPASAREVLSRLEALGGASEVAAGAAAHLRACSPLAAEVTFRQVLQSEGKSLLDCLHQEYAVNTRLQKLPEVREAIAAVSKGGTPKWEDVDDELLKTMADSIMAPLKEMPPGFFTQ